ncbi:MAG: ROK family transcriptional regulator [Planktomarina sp.]
MNLQSRLGTDPKLFLAHNERLILDLVRRHGELSKAEIARASNLSAQSATVIVKRLVEKRMLKAGKSIRGKVGQPSTPYRLDPIGATSIGIKVGRRSAEIAIMALDYSIIEHRAIWHDYPVYATLKDQLIALTKGMVGSLDDEQAQTIQGIGLALPADMWSWESAIGAPEGAMADWEHASLKSDLEVGLGLPVEEMNDASAACLASLRLGGGKAFQSFVYFYVGTFVGGGIALGDQVFEGMTGNAGAIGSLPTHLAGERKTSQLLDHASLHILEDEIARAGLDVSSLYTGSLDPDAEPIFERWLIEASDALAFAAIAGQAFLDPDGIVIDTSLSPGLRKRLVTATAKALDVYDQRGLNNVTLTECDVGIHARSLGSALLPYHSLLPDDA